MKTNVRKNRLKKLEYWITEAKKKIKTRKAKEKVEKNAERHFKSFYIEDDPHMFI